MDRTWSMRGRIGRRRQKAKGEEVWVRFAPARANVAFCCAVWRPAARGRRECATETRRHRGERGDGDRRFGGWVRFALASRWCALEQVGRSWRALARRACLPSPTTPGGWRRVGRLGKAWHPEEGDDVGLVARMVPLSEGSRCAPVMKTSWFSAFSGEFRGFFRIRPVARCASRARTKTRRGVGRTRGYGRNSLRERVAYVAGAVTVPHSGQRVGVARRS
jgi:hypothetical protein